MKVSYCVIVSKQASNKSSTGACTASVGTFGLILHVGFPDHISRKHSHKFNFQYSKCVSCLISVFVSLYISIKFRQWNKAMKLCLMEQHNDVALLTEVNKSKRRKESHVFFWYCIINLLKAFYLIEATQLTQNQLLCHIFYHNDESWAYQVWWYPNSNFTLWIIKLCITINKRAHL